MKARIVVALCVVLVAAGGVAWWVLARPDPRATETGTDPGTHSGAASSSPSSSSSPSGTPSSGPAPVKGKPIASCAPAQPAGSIESTFWGMHVASPIGADFPDAPIGALNLTTSQVYWNQVETSPGHYDFARLDDIVSTARSQDAVPMVVLGFTPSFHAQDPSSPTARTTMPAPRAWKAWVRAVVERYGDRLDYQVWPEPNIVGNWTGTTRQMAKLTAVAGRIVHANAPDAQVVAPAMALRLEGQQKWMDRFFAARSLADNVDAVAVDPFPLEDGRPEDALDLVCTAQRILDAHSLDLPVWVNEINYGVPSGGNATDVQHYADKQQAAYLARTYLLQAAVGTARVYWLGWGSYPGMAVELERDGAETPAARAYRTVHDWLAQAPAPDCRVRRDVHTCLVTRDGDALRIYWREHGTSVVRAEAGATRLATITGQARDVAAGDRIRVGTAPVAVSETP